MGTRVDEEGTLRHAEPCGRRELGSRTLTHCDAPRFCVGAAAVLKFRPPYTHAVCTCCLWSKDSEMHIYVDDACSSQVQRARLREARANKSRVDRIKLPP